MVELQCPACSHRFLSQPHRPRVEQPPGVTSRQVLDGEQLGFWAHGLKYDLRALGLLVAALAGYLAWRGWERLGGFDPARLDDLVFEVLPFAIAAVLALYYLSVRRYVQVDASGVRAWSSLNRCLELARRDVEQFYVTVEGELRAVRKSGAQVRLLKGKPVVMRYLEQRIEARLHLDDHPVAGEWRATPEVEVSVKVCPQCAHELASPEITRQVEPFARPAWLSEVGQGDRRVYSYRWFSLFHLWMLAWVIVWDSICLQFAAPGLSGFFTLLLLPHFWVGLGVTWWVLCCLVNRTVVVAQGDRIHFGCSPLPWWQPSSQLPWRRLDFDLRRDEVRQFYVVRVPGRQDTYHLEARLADGQRLRLLSGLTSSAGLLYLEQELERLWKIENLAEPD